SEREDAGLVGGRDRPLDLGAGGERAEAAVDDLDVVGELGRRARDGTGHDLGQRELLSHLDVEFDRLAGGGEDQHRRGGAGEREKFRHGKFPFRVWKSVRRGTRRWWTDPRRPVGPAEEAPL